MSKFNISVNKLSKIWELTESNRTKTINQVSDRTALSLSIKKINRVDLNLKVPLDISFDFEPLSINNNVPEIFGRPIYRNWQITFDVFDIRLLPFLKSNFIYRIGNGDSEVPIEDVAILIDDSDQVNEVIQEFALPRRSIYSADAENPETDKFLKKIIYNKSLTFPAVTTPDITVKLNVTLMNPYIFI